MPYSNKNYFGLLGLIIVLITGLLFFLLNSHSSDNSSSSLEKKEEIVNYQEEIANYQEENINEEKNNNFAFLDNTIINIIIFLLAFAIAFYFVYYFNFLATKVLTSMKTIFYKKMLFKGEYSFERWDYFFRNVSPKQEPFTLIASEVERSGGIKEYEINGDLYDPQITKIIIKEKMETNLEKFLTFKNSSDEREKIMKPFEKLPIVSTEEYYSDKIEKTNFDFDFNQPSYSEYFVNFKGSFDLFNRYNIIAFLLSSLFFLASFVIPYFVLYFFFVLFSTFFFLDEKEIKENKFLIAFYRALKALLLLNFRGLLKIIPGLLLLIILLLNGVLFFGNKDKFFCNNMKFKYCVFIYDVSDKNAKLEERIMNIYRRDLNLEDFFETGEISIKVDKKGPYYSNIPLSKK